VRRTAAHNTVAVDGRDQELGWGRCTLWTDGPGLHVVRASAPELIAGRQYERTVALVDFVPRGFCVLDVFRVVGGREHVLWQHGHFSTLSTTGLALADTEDYDHDFEMRSFRRDPVPAPGWIADWRVEDRLGYLPAGAEVHLRRIDLTPGAEALTCEGWVAPGAPHASSEAWIPRVAVRRRAGAVPLPAQGAERLPAQGAAPLASTFVGVIEPYATAPSITGARRLPLARVSGGAASESDVAIEITLADGGRFLFVAADVEHPLAVAPRGALVQEAWDVVIDGELCLVRRDASGRLAAVDACRARSLSVAGRRWECGGSDQWRWTHRGEGSER
jgi:hypothetical protein